MPLTVRNLTKLEFCQPMGEPVQPFPWKQMLHWSQVFLSYVQPQTSSPFQDILKLHGPFSLDYRARHRPLTLLIYNLVHMYFYIWLYALFEVTIKCTIHVSIK